MVVAVLNIPDVPLADFMDYNAIRGLLAVIDTPQVQECRRLYDRIAKYPQGVAWLEANRNTPTFELPPGSIFDKNYQRELLIRWSRHIGNRLNLLRSELEQYEPL